MTDTQARPLAVVTGASSGIGRSLARQFAQHGFDLVVCAEDAGIHAAAEELRRTGAEVRAVQQDLSTAEGVTALHRIVQETGPADAVALNAGIGVGGRFDETDLDRDLRLVDLNCRSTVHLAKLVSRDMVRRGSGRMLFTASVAAKAPGPFHATYAASKAFVHSFAEALRVELAESGVSVTSLMPGPTETEFFSRADMESTRLGQADKDDPDDVARDGFEALMAGKDHVVAGSAANHVQAVGGSLAPDKVAAAMTAKMTRPGSGES